MNNELINSFWHDLLDSNIYMEPNLVIKIVKVPLVVMILVIIFLIQTR